MSNHKKESQVDPIEEIETTEEVVTQPEVEMPETEECDALTQAQKELAALNDQYLRMMAEYDNYRKRTLKEKSDLLKTGGERILKELLPVVDDFELALKHLSEEAEMGLVEGVELIYQKLMDTLLKQGVQRIEAVGAPFDDNVHEAVAMIPSPSPEQCGKVIECLRTGYMLHDKVLRHAHVVVAN